jgi:hypothetical protein
LGREKGGEEIIDTRMSWWQDHSSSQETDDAEKFWLAQTILAVAGPHHHDSKGHQPTSYPVRPQARRFANILPLLL